MARNESDREDLIREATALIDRVEYQVSFTNESVVVGFRRDGSISFFMGPDKVFQFNSQDELRRGYFDGHLLKAERGKLVRLSRKRLDGEVQLVRHELNRSEEQAILSVVGESIAAIRDELSAGTAKPIRMVSSELNTDPHTDAHERVSAWITGWNGDIVFAASPRLSPPKTKSIRNR